MRVHSTESGETIRLGRRRFSLPLLVLPAAALVTAWAGMTNRLPPLSDLAKLELAKLELAKLELAELQDRLPPLALPHWSLPRIAWLDQGDKPTASIVAAPPALGHPEQTTAQAKSDLVAPVLDGLLDPAFSLGLAPVPLAQSAPLSSTFQLALAAPATEASPQSGAQASLSPEDLGDPEADLPDSVSPPHSVVEIPAPPPRPFELRAPAVVEPRVVTPLPNRRTRAAALPAPTADNRTFLEKLFNLKKPGETTLAYATPQDDVIDAARGRRLSPTPSPAAASAQFTAIYDISAKTVTMPNGERLEAHSGLGDKLDDPRFVHVRMRGATPPHVYDLSMREALFHGVRALRLNPVGGKDAIHGRDGLLAHTFMLGPNGDSNGCVSFRDYDKFLQAYLRGEVKRLVVVASM